MARALRLVGLVAAAIACSGGAVRSGSSPASSAGEDRRMLIFLLVGQSNMAGRAMAEAEDRVAVPHVFMLDRTEHWVPAVDPMHFDKSVAGVGPGRSFGVAIAQHYPTIDVGLVPAAVGGTSIASWAPGAEDPATRAHPYDDAVRRARAALRSGALAGIIWHQGESDSNPRMAPGYADRQRALIARFRADLGAPDVPFIVGQVGHFSERPWNKWRVMVNAAQKSLPSEMRNTAYVSSEGLTDRGDTLHFDARSARELGRRYAAAYLALRAVSPR